MSETKSYVPSEELSLSDRIKRMKGESNFNILGKNLKDAGRLETSVQQLEYLLKQLEEGKRPDLKRQEGFLLNLPLEEYKKEARRFVSELDNLIEQAKSSTIDPEKVETWEREVVYYASGEIM